MVLTVSRYRVGYRNSAKIEIAYYICELYRSINIGYANSAFAFKLFLASIVDNGVNVTPALLE